LIIFHPSNFYKSSISKRPYYLDDYAQEIFEFLNYLNLQKVHLIGHSAGGRQSIYFQNKYPDIVDKLVLMNSAGLKHKDATELAIKSSNTKFSKFNLDEKQQKILESTYKNIYNSDMTEIIKHISRETLIIWGKRDRVINVKKAYTLHKLIKNSRLQIFDHLDHSTINYSEPFEKIFEFFDTA
jgi:pimeloyl-ACP methyl ester carboxylesterase